MSKWIGRLAGLWAICAGAAAAVPPPAPAAPPAELLEPAYLYEVTRHLYRWYLDEADVEKQAPAPTFPFWVRRADVALDEGDRSQLATILLPVLGVEVQVKKADYAIDELGLAVRAKGFRIANVARVPAPAEPPPGTVVAELDPAEMREYLFRTRFQSEFPDAAMFERLRRTLREHFGLDPDEREAGRHVVHVAPLSPVANELWLYVENKKLLVRFASDVDLENPETWKHQALGIRTFDVLTQTIVSHDEAPGSNEFLTRDQVGRALYNCLVLGRRLEVVNPERTGAEQPETKRE